MNDLQIIIMAVTLLTFTALTCGIFRMGYLTDRPSRPTSAFKTAASADGPLSGGDRTAAPVACGDYRSYPAYLHENPDHSYTVYLRNWLYSDR